MEALEELFKTRVPPRRFLSQTGGDRFPSKELRRKIYIRSIREEISFYEPVGKWMIPCDYTTEDEMGMTELDKVWKVATDLYDEGVFIKVTCYTRAHTGKQGSINLRIRTPNYVTCYIENYKDVESVILSASEFRKRYPDFPYPLYLKTHQRQEDSTHEAIMRYMCCSDSDFYINENKGWKILKFSI